MTTASKETFNVVLVLGSLRTLRAEGLETLDAVRAKVAEFEAQSHYGRRCNVYRVVKGIGEHIVLTDDGYRVT